jgi:hypothetical protein
MPFLENENQRAAGIFRREIKSSKGSLGPAKTVQVKEQRSSDWDISLNARTGQETERNAHGVPTGFLSTCTNPGCASGWLHLWRSRSGPIFEGGWGCSAQCTAANIEAAVRREMHGQRTASLSHRHRVPLGLVMLERGWVTSGQLRHALNAQRAAGQGRLGRWLVSGHDVSEQLVTKALSLQWSCPVLSLDHHDPEAVASILPRLFVEAFGALPLRVAAGKIVYIGFEDEPDHVVAMAIERMLGLRVEVGLVCDSQFQPAHQRALHVNFPRTELVEAASESPLVRVLTKAVERFKPAESRLVRVHDCLWLRMWKNIQPTAVPGASGIEDVICSFAAH